MSDTYFITGATGFLGSVVLQELSAQGHTIYALARDPNKLKSSALGRLPGVVWVKGDITQPSVIRSVQARKRIQEEVTCVIHLAALYDLTATHEALYLANVVGTHNVVHFAQSLPKLKAFHYASTMAVAGDFEGLFTEEMFRMGQGFPNDYASTKFAAEACVREWETSVARFIYRFGILVGHSDSGEISKVDGPYYLMKALHSWRALNPLVNRMGWVALPFDEHVRLYMVPVDVAAQAVVTALGSNASGMKVYHVMGENGGTPIREVLKVVLDAFGFKGRLVPVSKRLAVPRLVGLLGIPQASLFYMYSHTRFSVEEWAKDFPEQAAPRFSEYSGAILEFAKTRLFSEVSQ